MTRFSTANYTEGFPLIGVFCRALDKLESIEDIPAAREALKSLLGEVRLLPENGALTAETQSNGLADAMQIALVAGAGFERCSPRINRYPNLR